MEPVRCARAFIPKNEAILICEGSIPKTVGCLCCEEPKTSRSLRAVSKSLPVSMLMDVQGSPIVHARTPKVSIVDDVTQRVNQVQPGAGQRTHPPNIARILGNFRLEEDNVNHSDSRIRIQAGTPRELQPA